MAAIVQIDQPLTAVTVQAGQRQEVGFDVVNVAGRTLNVVAMAIPGNGGAVPDWVTVEGERTLRLGPSETRKVTLAAAPPANAAAGTATLRLKVYEVSMPEENNGFSETVNVTVTPAPPIAPRRPWKAIAAVAAVLVLGLAGGGLAYRYLARGELPAVEGQTLAAAQRALAELGVAATSISVDSPIDRNADGTVTGQSPPAGTPIDDALTVTLTVPRLPVLPEVVGLSRSDAGDALAAAQILPSSVQIEETLETDPSRQGIVVEQAPVAGESLHAGESVVLQVSRPPKEFSLPEPPADATGETARAHYEAMGLTVEIEEDLDAPGRVPGKLLKIRPWPGTPVREGETIRLTVLSEEAFIPSFTWRLLTDDIRVALNRSFRLNVREAPAFYPVGCIIDQSRFDRNPRGSQVILDVVNRQLGGSTACRQ